MSAAAPLLEVRHLRVEFATRRGVVLVRERPATAVERLVLHEPEFRPRVAPEANNLSRIGHDCLRRVLSIRPRRHWFCLSRLKPAEMCEHIGVIWIAGCVSEQRIADCAP